MSVTSAVNRSTCILLDNEMARNWKCRPNENMFIETFVLNTFRSCSCVCVFVIAFVNRSKFCITNNM